MPPKHNGFILSFAELKAILTLVGIQAFPDLEDQDPALGRLTSEQEAYGLLCGERALRARGFAFINEEGALRIRNDILEAIGVCAFAPDMLVVTYLPSSRATGQRFTLFHLDDHYVSHYLPEPALHLFTTYANREAAIHDLAGLVPQPETTTPQIAFRISETALKDIQTAIDAGDSARARTYLPTEIQNQAGASVFLQDLASPHVAVFVQAVHRVEQDSITIQTGMVIGTQDRLWLIAEQESEEIDSAARWYDIRNGNRNTLNTFIHNMKW